MVKKIKKQNQSEKGIKKKKVFKKFNKKGKGKNNKIIKVKNDKEKKDDKNNNVKKISKILNEDKNNNKSKEFDLLFLIDATGSMGPYIDAAKDESKNISDELRKLYPDMNFQYGYVFYRDPIDSPSDIHEVIDLTDDVNSLPVKIKKIIASGGGDLPEDWVGAYKKANEEISWRNGNKVIIHLADAGAHGREFTPSDKYQDEGEKLMYELEECFQKNIKIFGYVIKEDARKSFNECQKIYKKKGGEYEIIDFIKQSTPLNLRDFSLSSFYDEGSYLLFAEDSYLYGSDDYECVHALSRPELGLSLEGIKREYGRLKQCKSKKFSNETGLITKGQEEINSGFRGRVINSVKSVLKKK